MRDFTASTAVAQVDIPYRSPLGLDMVSVTQASFVVVCTLNIQRALEQEQHDAAIALFERTLDIKRNTVGEEHQTTIRLRQQLDAARQRQVRWPTEGGGVL